MNKSKAAFQFAVRTLGKQRLYMWTFTFKEALDIKDTRKRWNYLLILLKRRWPNLCGLRVFELHDMHGLHVHLATNRFIDVNEARRLAKQAGWGRIHVMRIPVEKAGYLAKYLSKDREPCLKRWRLWAGFGKAWDWTKVRDVVLETPRTIIYQACKESFEWVGNKGFKQRMELVESIYRKTIAFDWPLGRGPNGIHYFWMQPSQLLA